MSTQTPSRQSQPMSDRQQQMQNRPMSDTQNVRTREMDMRADGGRPVENVRRAPAPGTETKASWKSTELWIYLAAVGGVLIAAEIVGRNSVGVDIFRADNAWFLITLLTLGYLVSRGLAKAGSNWRSSDERGH